MFIGRMLAWSAADSALKMLTKLFTHYNAMRRRATIGDLATRTIYAKWLVFVPIKYDAVAQNFFVVR